MRVLRISHSAVMGAWRERERALRRLGVDVNVLSAEVWNEAGRDVPLEPEPGEPVKGVRTWGSHPALFLYDPRPVWRALGEHWDVVDIHEEPFALATAEILLLRALRRQRAPYVLYSAQNLAKRYPPPFRWLERWALTHAAGMNVCNDEAGRIVEDKGFPGAATRIALGLDTGRFSPTQVGYAGASPTSEPPVVVGYAGRLEDHKGVSVLLDAVGRDERLQLKIAGSGPAEPRLRAQAEKVSLDGRVTFLGPLGQEELPGHYRSIDVLAVPSLTTPTWVEQFGRVAVEAMACGTPVVASDSGALPDVVGGAGLLVPPGDADALADALLEVGLKDDLAAELRAAGLARAAECDWDAVAEEHLDVYGRVTHAPIANDGRRLELVVVAYGSPDLLRRSLTPLAHLGPTVIDNSSSADVRSVCDDLDVTYVDPGYNGGFAAGVNAGLDRITGPADVLLLNPDAVIDEAGVTALHRALLDAPDAASAGPAQVDVHGIPSRVIWPFPSPAGTWLEAIGLGRLRTSPDFVIGSVLLLRAEALAQVGRFDERFFLYAEETDWARRAVRLGWRHIVVNDVTATHVGAATSSDPVRRETHFHASQERYVRKHFGDLRWQVARAGHIAGSAVRAVVLPDERGLAARTRVSLYARGPVRAEAAYPRERSPHIPAVAP